MVTGFPSPAQGYESKTIDLNQILIKHPSVTVFIQIETSRYSNMGIYKGDLLVIDRAKKITQNSLVIYEEDGHFVLGRVCNIQKEAVIAGSIIHVIHTVKDL